MKNILFMRISILMVSLNFMACSVRSPSPKADYWIKGELIFHMKMQELFYLEHNRYAKNFNELNYDPCCREYSNGMKICEHFDIIIYQESEDHYQVWMQEKSDYNKDGKLSSWSIDEIREFTRIDS